MAFFIIKASGEKEEFDLQKFRNSLQRAGADAQLINDIIVRLVDMKPKSTQEIHDFASEQLALRNRSVATRYNVKRALFDFGPDGFPFERYVAALLHEQGYEVVVDQFVQGACVVHEVDVIAIKDNKKYMGECKFHNNAGIKTDIKVALYIQARFEDVQQGWKKNELDKNLFYQPWLFSNNKFTTDAIIYAKCVNMLITGWSYPAGSSLGELIDKYGLHPITALTSISRKQKSEMIRDHIILARDVEKMRNNLAKYRLNKAEIDQLLKEVGGLHN